MKSETDIKKRLDEIKSLKNKVADITGHGYPMTLTIYEEALLWVIDCYNPDVNLEDDMERVK